MRSSTLVSCLSHTLSAAPRFFSSALCVAVVTTEKNNNRYRYKDPLVGDKVEVSWEGRFRLESLDVFVGRSWWEATVVQKVDGYM